MIPNEQGREERGSKLNATLIRQRIRGIIKYRKEGSTKMIATANFWRTKELSVRASNCLAKANITDERDLIKEFTTFDCLLALRNCGRKTAEEIWTYLTNLKTRVPNCDWGSEITSSDPGDEHSIESESVFIPLLDIEVSAHTWETLEKTPVNRILWSVRTRNVFRGQGVKTIAEIAALSPKKWLRFRNFGRKSLTEIQERITEIIEQLRVNPSLLDPGDEHSIESESVFIPLLDIEVSAHTWETLEKTPVNRILWSVRTRNVFRGQGVKTIAEIAALSPKKWLRFRNFGRKSLTEIQETVNQMIANPNALDPRDVISAEVSQIQTLYGLGRLVFERLQTRQQEIVKSYYGYEGTRKNLQQIGEALGITRERVRQIKRSANQKITHGADNHLITTTVFRLLNESIRDVLAKADGYCSVKNLMAMIRQRLGWGDGEQWVINWFDEAFGEAWICLGADDYKMVNGVCHLKSGELVQGFLSGLATRLQRYGYRPLTLEECQSLLNKTNATAFDSDRLLAVIASYPALKVYQYGETYIGLKAWTWFSPEKPTVATAQAALIEWYLRMTNEPATVKTIANGIGSELGNFRSMPFDVANSCEKQPDRFRAGGHDAYGLYLWEDASQYRQALTELLSDAPLPIERIAEALAQEPGEIMLIVAALNFYRELFVETPPFEWALRSQAEDIETETDVDYATLTFEDLMPKL